MAGWLSEPSPQQEDPKSITPILPAPALQKSGFTAAAEANTCTYPPLDLLPAKKYHSIG